MKAHKEDTHTRLSLLEQSHEYTIKTMQDIKYQIQTLTNEVREGFKEIDKKLEKIDHRFEKSDAKISELKKEINVRFDKIENRVYNVLFTFCASVIGYVVAKVYHLI